MEEITKEELKELIRESRLRFSQRIKLYGAVDALETAESANAALLKRAEDAEQERNALEGLLASTTDLLNSWAREYGVNEAPNEQAINGVVNRLWDRCALLRTERDHLKHASKGDSAS